MRSGFNLLNSKLSKVDPHLCPPPRGEGWLLVVDPHLGPPTAWGGGLLVLRLLEALTDIFQYGWHLVHHLIGSKK